MPDPTDPVGRLVAYLGSLIASKSRGEHLPVGATRRELADHRARVLAIASSPADVPTLKSCLDAVQAAVEGMLAAPDDGPKAERATQEAETALAGLYDLLPVSRAAVASAGTPEGKQGEGGKPPDDPFADLRQFARTELKGQERAVIESLCNASGELPIADLAVKEGVGWEDTFDGFKNAQKRLNPKLKRIGWTLTRQNNAATLKQQRG